ncbi:MAG: hypothetical protein QOD70_1165, partial [Frankiales bacterium]|nr:hypothetical protein [Frankiales bacterium]
MAAGERVTYRAVLRNREFAAILVSQALSIFGDQVARIALAVLVFERTGSALAASATYGVAFISYMVAGPMLSTLADRYPRRTIMVAADVGRAVVVAVLAIGGLPLPAVFALITLQGVLAPAFDSARSASLPQILLGDAYVKGSALYNIAFQGTQVVGFLAGGALLTSFSVSRVLAFDAGTYLISAGAILGVLLARPSATEPASSRGIVHDTVAGVRVVWYDSRLRRLLAFSLLGAAVVAAPEGLAIPVASELGGASLAAGILTASIPAGFVVGTLLVLSVPSHRRVRLLPVLTALSAVPLVA